MVRLNHLETSTTSTNAMEKIRRKMSLTGMPTPGEETA